MSARWFFYGMAMAVLAAIFAPPGWGVSVGLALLAVVGLAAGIAEATRG